MPLTVVRCGAVAVNAGHTALFFQICFTVNKGTSLYYVLAKKETKIQTEKEAEIQAKNDTEIQAKKEAKIHNLNLSKWYPII